MFLLTPPVSDRDHCIGAPPLNKVILVKYGDYQCFECGKIHSVVKTLQQQFSSQLCFVFRHFPLLDIHPHAQHAAEAALSAAKQGKFWQMHDCLFQNQGALGNGYLVEYAVMLGLEVNQFLQDIAHDVHVERIQQDVDSGIKSGVSKTPTFFINGVRYDGECKGAALSAEIAKQIKQL